MFFQDKALLECSIRWMLWIEESELKPVLKLKASTFLSHPHLVYAPVSQMFRELVAVSEEPHKFQVMAEAADQVDIPFDHHSAALVWAVLSKAS